MGYIGNEPTTGHFPVQTNLVGPGPTYTLTQAPATAGAIEVSVAGVLQPTTAYSVSGTTLTMAGVAAGIPIFIRHLGETLSLPTPADGSVTDVKIAAGAVTDAKIADMAATKLTGSVDIARLPAAVLNSNVPATDTSVLEYNIAMLAFKHASQNQITKFAMVDQMVDEYQDTTGIDAGASTNELTAGSGTAKYFHGGAGGTGPTGGSSTGNYTHGGLTYYFNKFTADTNLVVTDGGTADVFLIGGGGSASGDNGGGGGAGGLIWKAGHTFAGSTTYAIDIGDGGTGSGGGAQGAATMGKDTTLATTTFVAKGGGYGGSGGKDAADGGSGGGAGRVWNGGSVKGDTTQSSQAGDSGTYGFGFDGGTGIAAQIGPGGGGGGTGNVGVNAAAGTVGNGGVGKSNFVNSSTTETTAFLLALTAGTDSSNVATVSGSTGTLYIGGGGSGGTENRGTNSGGGVGGLGGGGNIGVAALANTGSGGAGNTSSSGNGTNGGSGLAIIRYLASNFSSTGADLILKSNAATNAPATAPTTGDLVVLIDDGGSGTTTEDVNVKGFISRNGNFATLNTDHKQAEFTDEGSWGTAKQRILVSRNVDLSGLTTGTSMNYMITTHSQSAGTMETRIHATSLAWA